MDAERALDLRQLTDLRTQGDAFHASTPTDADTGADEADEREADAGNSAATPGVALRPFEQVVARRTEARLIRAEEAGLSSHVFDGSLILTNQRLIHIGTLVYPIPLGEIAELTLAGERLLVSLRDGRGFALEVSSPEDLRTAIAVQLKQSHSSSR